MRQVAILALVMSACVGFATLPPSGPGTAYPCGLHGISCGGGMCCSEGDVCGGAGPDHPQTCAPGYCCADGASLFGARKPTRQWRP